MPARYFVELVDGEWKVTIECGDERWTAIAADAFEALCSLRGRLEPEGYVFGLEGARPNVWPSGMARDMGGGLRAYVNDSERIRKREALEMINVFDPTDIVNVVDLSGQRDNLKRLGVVL